MSHVAFLDVFVPGAETSGLTLYYGIAVLMVLFCVHIEKCDVGSLQDCSAEFHESNFKFECQDVWDFAGQNQHEATILRL